ncbi:cell division protein FtsQ/DivIB [Lacticaseibacillus saniviri]
MAWFKRQEKPVKQTPWEQYQAQTKAQSKRPKVKANLPNLTALRRNQLRRNLWLVVTPIVLLLAFFGYMVSPLAKVDLVTVTGTEITPDQTIIDASHLAKSDLILGLLMNPGKVTTRIEKLPEIKAAKLQVSDWHNVTLHVTEYTPVGYVVRHNQYHLVLETGYIEAKGQTNPNSNYPIFTGFTKKELPKIIKTVAKFPKAIRQDIAEIKATRGDANPYQITLNMGDGNKIIADSRTIAKKIQYYPSIVAQVKTTGTVDLEVGAFFSPAKK